MTGGEYSISLLNGFALQHDGEPLELSRGSQRVVAYIAVHDDPVTRPRLAEAIWGFHNDRHAFGSLRSALHRVGKVAPRLITSKASRLDVRPNASVDIDSVETIVQHCHRAEDISHLDPLTKELLPGWWDDWVLFERERLRQRSMHAIESFARQRLSLGETAAAIDTALKSISIEPLRETAWGILIECHLREGNVSEAVRAFESLSTMLGRDLGLNPSEKLTHLFPPDIRATLTTR